MWLARVGLRDLDPDLPAPAELGDGCLDVVERLAVKPVLVLDGGDALALDGARDDQCGHPCRCRRLRERAVDRLDVVTVDRDRVPAERAGARDVTSRSQPTIVSPRCPSRLTSRIAVRLSSS